MKMTIEIDCTPEEARRFMGLPDTEQANAFYLESLSTAMKGVSGGEQVERYARQLAPMGQMGIKLFQTFLETAMANAGAPAAPSTGPSTASSGTSPTGSLGKDDRRSKPEN